MSGSVVNSRARLLVWACALAVSAASAPAMAAEATANGAPLATQVGEIVVTAERRSTDIQKTPLAITAVSAGQLDKSFINEISGLNALVPGLEATKTSGFENIVTIRGVGSETPENDLTTVPGVAFYIDGVYIPNTVAIDQTLFDIDHVEILRGPQGALYGVSATGGAILIVTSPPQLNTFSGYGDFTGGNYHLTRERAWLNVPIGSTAALRVSLQRYDHEGFSVDEAIPGLREDDAHDTSAKAALLWQPVSNFSATLTGQYYRTYGNGAEQKNINDPESNPWQFFQDYPNKSELTTDLVHLNLQYDFPAFSIRSVSAYQRLNDVTQEDSSRSAFSILGSYDDVAAWNTWTSTWSEEFDILSKPGGKVDWIAGAFLLTQQATQYVAEFEGSTAPTPADLVVASDIESNPPSNLAYGNDSHFTRRSYAGFAQATVHILPTVRLTVGGRYNYDSIGDVSFNFHEVGEGPPTTAAFTRTGNVATWRAEADWDVAPDNMLYLSANRGYKPGGPNGNLADPSGVIPTTFVPETNTAFEVGSKNFLLDHTLRFNVSAFYYLYSDMQYIEVDPIPFASAISNIPSVHTYGVEAEATYISPDSRLRIDGSLALENGYVNGAYHTIDSTIANAIESQPFPNPCAFGVPPNFGGPFNNPPCWAEVIAGELNIQGKVPPAMPKVSGAISAQYSFDLLNGKVTPRVEFIYRGSEWARIFNDPILDPVPAYGIVNLNLEYRPNNSHFWVGGSITNVGNVAGVNSRYTDPFGSGQTSQQFIPPRQYMLSAGFGF